jgi:hypothetical protein
MTLDSRARTMARNRWGISKWGRRQFMLPLGLLEALCA